MPRKTQQMWRHMPIMLSLLAPTVLHWQMWMQPGIHGRDFGTGFSWWNEKRVILFMYFLNFYMIDIRESKWLIVMYRISTSFSCHVKPRSSKCPVWPNKCLQPSHANGFLTAVPFLNVCWGVLYFSIDSWSLLNIYCCWCLVQMVFDRRQKMD